MEKIPHCPIKLREKPMADGCRHLYLDFYFDGHRKYEYLRIYVLAIPENASRAEAKAINAKNAEARKLANAILARRIVEFNENRVGAKVDRSFVSLFGVYDRYQKEVNSESMFYRWRTTRKHLLNFCKDENMMLSAVDHKFCEDFLLYLKTLAPDNANRHVERYSKNRKSSAMPVEQRKKEMSASTIRSIYAPFTIFLNKCVRNDLLVKNPAIGVKLPELNESVREFLTIDELKTLMATPYFNDTTSRSFIFACFTGLRWSDVKKAKWSEVIYQGDRVMYRTVQQKTKKSVFVELSRTAQKAIGQKGDSELIFPEIGHHSVEQYRLQRWVENAGIRKNITFHSARHTQAITQLTLGTDLYTVSKILGHTNIGTTQVYTKIIDQKRIEAANRLDEAFE